MGRFKKERITIKRFEGFEIIFYDRETIWIQRDHSIQRVIYHRWFGPRYSYGSWRAFDKALHEATYLSPVRIAQLAHRYNISWHQTTRAPNLENKPLRIIMAKKAKRREPWTTPQTKTPKNG